MNKMLRYNNQPTKPVDYYRPLTVDVSVEYELPKEVSPPPGSAPLLIIHPSAYFRSKVHQPSSSNSSSSSTSSSPSSGHHQHHGPPPPPHRGLPSSISGRSSRHPDLNFYLGNGSSSRGHGSSSSSNNGSSNNNNHHLSGNSMSSMGLGRHGGLGDGMMMGGGSNSNSRNYRSNGSNSSSSSSSTAPSSLNRSRNIGLSGTSEMAGRSVLNYHGGGEYSNYPSEMHRSTPSNPQSHYMSSSSGSSASSRLGNNSSAMKKVGGAERGDRNGGGAGGGNSMMMRDLRDRLATYGFSNGTSSSSTSSSLNGNHNNNVSSFASSNLAGSPMMIGSNGGSPGLNTFGVSSSTHPSGGTTTTNMSNKRLRMMNQGGMGLMEPLNLAVQSSGSNPLLNPGSSSYHSSSVGSNNNTPSSSLHHHPHLSSFLGGSSYKENTSHNSSSGIHSTNNSSNSSASMMGLGLNYGSSFSNANNNNYHHSRTGSSGNLLHQYSLSSTSGTGSSLSGRFSKECPVPVDKGSGSDSGVCSENDSDPSPPMQPFSSSVGHRRSALLSQELPGSGCYCCCCPSTNDMSSTSRSKAGGMLGGGVGSSHSKLKSSTGSSSRHHGQNYLQHPLGANNSNLGCKMGGLGNGSSSSGSSSSSASRSLLNYGMSSMNPATISMSMMAFQPDVHLNGMSGLDGSPASMAAAAAAMIGASGSSPLDLDLTYRKWLGSGIGGTGGAGGTPGLVCNGNGPALGRWFQV